MMNDYTLRVRYDLIKKSVEFRVDWFDEELKQPYRFVHYLRVKEIDWSTHPHYILESNSENDMIDYTLRVRYEKSKGAVELRIVWHDQDMDQLFGYVYYISLREFQLADDESKCAFWEWTIDRLFSRMENDYLVKMT